MALQTSKRSDEKKLSHGEAPGEAGREAGHPFGHRGGREPGRRRRRRRSIVSGGSQQLPF